MWPPLQTFLGAGGLPQGQENTAPATTYHLLWEDAGKAQPAKSGLLTLRGGTAPPPPAQAQAGMAGPRCEDCHLLSTRKIMVQTQIHAALYIAVWP